MKQGIEKLLFVVLISFAPLFASATPFNDSVDNYTPELFPKAKTNYTGYSLNNNYSLEKQGMFFARAELTTIPSFCVGYGGIYQVFASVGYGLISNAKYAMIGYRTRFFGGYKWGMGFEVKGGVSLRNYNSVGVAVGCDMFYSYKNFDFKCLGIVLDKESFESGNADFSIGVCYNFRSKKYWDYKLEQYREQMGWEKSKGYDKRSNNQWQLTPTYPNIQNTPCPTHIKYGPRNYVELETLIDKQNDGIVGIYEDAVSGGYELAVLKNGNSYRIVYLSGGSSKCWEFAHVKADLRSTATPGLFKATWYLKNFTTSESCVITFNGTTMDVNMPGIHNVYIKMYPEWGTTKAQQPEERWYSGTAWALGDGYVVTNYHVIESALAITIQGIGGDFNTKYSAVMVAYDAENDIAILKINDSRFSGFGTIPYGISDRVAGTREEVAVMGWPRGRSLGDEVKTTTGTINALSGVGKFQDCYQIQAPITHGNSGGPMFDNRGNVIGIAVAGIDDKEYAENVGYAIKISHLKALIKRYGLNITLPQNSISNLTPTEQDNRVKRFVYYVEVMKYK